MGDMTMAVEVMSSPALKKLLRKSDRKVGQHFVVYPYVNGREKGFMIADCRDGLVVGKGRAVAFSENRNSDSLVMYLGKNYSVLYSNGDKDTKDPLQFIFDMNHDVIKLTDEIWEKHSYYVWCNRPAFYKMVGKLIADYVNGAITEKVFGEKVRELDKFTKKSLGY